MIPHCLHNCSKFVAQSARNLRNVGSQASFLTLPSHNEDTAMKKTLMITALIAALGASVAMADHGFGGKGVERMKTALGLSDTQAAQVDVIMQEQKTKMEALRNETQQRIQALLTPEQAAKFAEMQQQREQHRQQRMERMQQKQGGWGF